MAKLTSILPMALAALMLHAVAPECALRTARADELGKFCAAPANGPAYCVSSNRSPADAWNQAAARGRLPIEMWAEWPSNVTPDDIVRSPDQLEAWFADVDKVLAYVRDTQKNAESYRASLAGRLRKLLDQVKARQKEILGSP